MFYTSYSINAKYQDLFQIMGTNYRELRLFFMRLHIQNPEILDVARIPAALKKREIFFIAYYIGVFLFYLTTVMLYNFLLRAFSLD